MKQITIEDGQVVPPSKKPCIHNVILLDASASMNSASAGKTRYQAALEGINQEIDELKSDITADYLMSIYEFDSVELGKERITEHAFMTNVQKLEHINGVGAAGNTPLYQTIAYVLETFLRKASRQDKVVVKIFTDGAHNCMWGKYGKADVCKELIRDAEQNAGYVITFVGTQQDVQHAVEKLGVYASNTAVYDGTPQGLTRSMKMSTNSLKSYAASVQSGTATTDNFYSQKPNVNDNQVSTN